VGGGWNWLIGCLVTYLSLSSVVAQYITRYFIRYCIGLFMRSYSYLKILVIIIDAYCVLRSFSGIRCGMWLILLSFLSDATRFMVGWSENVS
jgi:hypothetical protein